MTINGFLFFWLVVFAVIGILATLIGGVGLFAVFCEWLQWKREQQQKNLEYESLKQALFDEINPK